MESSEQLPDNLLNNNLLNDNLLNININTEENIINKEDINKYLNIDNLNIKNKNIIISCINDIGILEGPFCIIGKNNIIIQGNKNINEEIQNTKKVNINGGDFKFKGDLINFYLHKGEYIKNNFRYKGEFYNNMFNGVGKINYIDTEEHFYDGTFKNGKYDGGGLLRINDTHYIGEFVDGLYHGKGTIKENNIVYEGEFQNGIKHGSGVEYNDNDNIIKYIVIYDTNVLISKKNKIEQDYEESLIKINKLEEEKTELITNLNNTNNKVNELKNKYDDQMCKICYDRKINILLIPCNHATMCNICANNLFRRSSQYNHEKKCPICRRRSTSQIEIIFN